MSSIDQDVRVIREAERFSQAVVKLVEQLNVDRDIAATDLATVDYREDRFLSLLLYLVAFRNQARGWTKDTAFRIGFHGDSLVQGFSPEWHHFFPRALLRNAKAPGEHEAVANMVVLPSRLNKAFSQKPPCDYLVRFAVPPESLEEQYLPLDKSLWDVGQYPRFLEWRSIKLAQAMNSYLRDLET